MRRVARTNTAPELTVRRYLHARGLRYGLHRRELPGTPDIVLPRHRSVVFVNGCFWHGHECKHGRVRARSNADYWEAKIADNRERDRRNRAKLRMLGWRVETIWECQCGSLAMLDRLARRLLHR